MTRKPPTPDQAYKKAYSQHWDAGYADYQCVVAGQIARRQAEISNYIDAEEVKHKSKKGNRK